MARMIVADHDYVTSRYKLRKLKELEDLVAEAVEVNVPFNNPITGFCAFTHKAGIHAKAILNNPSTYEILNPADFGLTRYVHFAPAPDGRLVEVHAIAKSHGTIAGHGSVTGWPRQRP